MQHISLKDTKSDFRLFLEYKHTYPSDHQTIQESWPAEDGPPSASSQVPSNMCKAPFHMQDKKFQLTTDLKINHFTSWGTFPGSDFQSR